MNLKNTAIIGSYSSDKLLLLNYDVQRSSDRTIQQTKHKKVVGETRQNIIITLEGRITCSTFHELEEEKTKLLDALNKKVINLVIGSTPDRFYRVSWSGAGLANRAGSGGPNLPISLDFECIDEGAIVGVPVGYGGTSIAGVPWLVSNLGKPVEAVTVLDYKSFFSKGLKLWNMLAETGVRVSSGKASFYFKGQLVKSWPVPLQDKYSIGLVFLENQTKVYIDGRDYLINTSFDNLAWVFATDNISYFGGFPFEADDSYMEYISKISPDKIIEGLKVTSESMSFRYEGMNNTPASVYTTSGVERQYLSLADFGATFVTPASGWLSFNTVEGSVSASNDDYLDAISYNGRFTLLPRLQKGTNTFQRNLNNNDVYIFWRRMVR